MTRDWQPDLSRGLFETLLVAEGEPVEAEAHLRRLTRSLQALYLLALPDDAGERLRAAAAGLALGRLRLTAGPPDEITGWPGPIIARFGIDAAEADPANVFPSQGARLRTRSLPGGLGGHKWIDRPGLDRPARDDAGPLLVDEGEVLEAGWANVFAVRGGTLFTPPLDGRILPGTTRAALLAVAPDLGVEAQERRLRARDLLGADEVFLSGSIRGIEPAIELDEQPLAGSGPLSHRLADGLRRRWGLPDAVGALPTPATAPPPDPPAR
ncbi:MAG TPA: aminotransferase class IV [Solirubrobacterales bacterium]|nr:aminotransferase class IV [Solirubrobacterales bacterium]